MFFKGMRPVRLLFLLCAVGHPLLAFPTQTSYIKGGVQKLSVTVSKVSPISTAPLGGSITVPCQVSLSPGSPSSPLNPVPPRVKWSMVREGELEETEILVARGERVKVSEAYRQRAQLVRFVDSPEDFSLGLWDLRSSDTGHYRCEVQHGLDDSSDFTQIKVKGVAFHYRHATGRYAFSFIESQRACQGIGAHIATPDQLMAAYNDGYEQCDAGWLADQSVRYPIQVPREGCYGDMDGSPGVRNYGTLEADELFDVYCYVEHIDGEVFHGSAPQQLSFDEAQAYCEKRGAEVATTGQLYLAWREGLDRCNPGWLSDGSVRYPIVTPRERCGGPQSGVKTLYRYSNRTGFPDPSSRHDVYCFKGNGNAHTAAPMDYVATEPEDMGQDMVVFLEPAEELHLSQAPEQVEREAQSVLESLPVYQSATAQENFQGTPANAVISTKVPLAQTLFTQHFLQASDDTPFSSLPSTSNGPDSFDKEDFYSQNSTSLPRTSNEPDSLDEKDYHSQNPTSLPSTFNEQDSLAEDYYNSQHSTSLPSSASDPDFDPIYLVVGPMTSSEPDAYEDNHSQHTDSLLNTTSMLDLLPESNTSLSKPETETTPEFPEPSYEPHRHYQSMPEMNKEEPEHQQSGSSKHFQPMPEINLELDEVEANHSTTEGNKRDQETAQDTTAMAFDPNDVRDPTVERVHKEVAVSGSEGTSISTKSPHQAQSTLYPDGEPSSLWLPLDGSGSQELDLGVLHGMPTDGFPTSESSTSSGTNHTSASPGATSIPSEQQTQVPYSSRISPGLDHSEESGLEGFSTVAVHSAPPRGTLQGNSFVRPEGSSSLDIPGYVLPESLEVPKESESVPDGSDEEPLGFGVETVTTETTGLTTNTQLLPEMTSLGNQTTLMSRTVLYPRTTDLEEDKSGHAQGTDEPSIREEVPLGSQASSWDLNHTTSAPQEFRENFEYSGEPPSASSQTKLLDSSVEPDALGSDSASTSSTDPTAATVSTSTEWATPTRRPSTTTSTTQHVLKTSEPERVTAIMPPVNQGRADPEFGITQPPTLLILPNEGAAVGSARKISDACLEDPCVNGGTCVEVAGSRGCLCLPSYGGDLCQTDLEQCEVGWQKFHGNCYKHFTQRLSWEVAEQHCRLVGAHLMSIMTPEEQDFINHNYREYQWTGLNDKTIEGDFRWSDDNPLLYENWYRGQPDSYFLSGEDCVVMVWHDSGRWSDVPCNYHLAYTCKKSTSSCGAPPKVPNATVFGRIRKRYETDTIVRYYCGRGFQQRQNPLVRCLPSGRWEEPHILCIPVGRSKAQAVGMTSTIITSKELAEETQEEEETQTTKPLYWDIKWN